MYLSVTYKLNSISTESLLEMHGLSWDTFFHCLLSSYDQMIELNL